MMLILGVLRRAPKTSTRCNISTFQNVASRNLPPLRRGFRTSGVKFESTGPKTKAQSSPKPQPQQYAFPERLCVYHAGTGRITFLACLKLSTLFIFVFFGFVVTPSYIDKEGLSPTVLRTTLSAIIPLIFVAYVTSPFVSFIHMRLPPFARQSEDMLRRYARSLPADTELDVGTMSLIAKPRVTRVKLSELRPVRRRLGIVNWARDTAAENAARKWYMFRAVGEFGAQSNTAKRAPWVWEAIVKAVEGRRG